MKSAIVFFLLLLVYVGKGQNAANLPVAQIQSFPEQMPEYPGGEEALQEFLHKNLVYPKVQGDSIIRGRVIMRFTVTETGDVTNVTVQRGLAPRFDNEAIRVIRLFPKFKPAKQAGKPVSSNYLIPIVFSQ